MGNRRFLKKVGATELRLFGYTPVLAAKKDMIECDFTGRPLFPLEKEQPLSQGINAIKTFELGMEFRMTGEKTLKAWIHENFAEINSIGIDIQGLIISKWRKYFNDEPMPIVCTFIVSGISEEIGKDKPEITVLED